MNLKEEAEKISCNHIQFLDKKYDLYNNFIFKNNLKCNLSKDNYKHISNNPEKINYLNSIYIDKKSCFNYKPPPDENNNLLDVQYTYNLDIPVKFNINTRNKININN